MACYGRPLPLPLPFRGMAPCILNLSSRWTWPVKAPDRFTHGGRRRSLRTLSVGGSVPCSPCLDPSFIMGFEPRFIDRPVHSLITVTPVVSSHTKGSSFQVIYLRVWTQLALDTFPWNLILIAFMKICRDIPELVKIEQKFQALCMKTQVYFTVVSDRKWKQAARITGEVWILTF